DRRPLEDRLDVERGRKIVAPEGRHGPILLHPARVEAGSDVELADRGEESLESGLVRRQRLGAADEGDGQPGRAAVDEDEDAELVALGRPGHDDGDLLREGAEGPGPRRRRLAGLADLEAGAALLDHLRELLLERADGADLLEEEDRGAVG